MSCGEFHFEKNIKKKKRNWWWCHDNIMFHYSWGRFQKKERRVRDYCWFCAFCVWILIIFMLSFCCCCWYRVCLSDFLPLSLAFFPCEWELLWAWMLCLWKFCAIRGCFLLAHGVVVNLLHEFSLKNPIGACSSGKIMCEK